MLNGGRERSFIEGTHLFRHAEAAGVVFVGELFHTTNTVPTSKWREFAPKKLFIRWSQDWRLRYIHVYVCVCVCVRSLSQHSRMFVGESVHTTWFVGQLVPSLITRAHIQHIIVCGWISAHHERSRSTRAYAHAYAHARTETLRPAWGKKNYVERFIYKNLHRKIYLHREKLFTYGKLYESI